MLLVELALRLDKLSIFLISNSIDSNTSNEKPNVTLNGLNFIIVLSNFVKSSLKLNPYHFLLNRIHSLLAAQSVLNPQKKVKKIKFFIY